MPEDIASSCMIDSSRRMSPIKPRFDNQVTGRFDKDTPVYPQEQRQQKFVDNNFFSDVSQRQCLMNIPVSAELKASHYRPSNLTSVEGGQGQSPFGFMDDMQPITIRVEDRKLPELKREELFNGPPQKHISLRPSTQRAHSAVSPGQKINRTFTKEDDDFILMCE